MTPPLPKGLRPRPARPGTKPARNGARANGATVTQDPKALKKARKQAQREAFKQQALDVPISMLGWLDERTGSTPFLRAFLFRKVPKGTNWYYTLGSATMFAFVNQAVNGVFLAMYFDPSATQAYGSIPHNINHVWLGSFLRGGSEFGATTLSRFYAIHMLLIPGLIAALIGAHLYLVAKLGTTAPPWLKAEKARELAEEEI